MKIRCTLKNTKEDVIFSPNSGQNLDAIEGYNAEWQLHIGTENDELMYSRAQRGDWFPKRFITEGIDFFRSITIYLEGDLGLETKIPKLEKGEKIHI